MNDNDNDNDNDVDGGMFVAALSVVCAIAAIATISFLALFFLV